LSEIKNILILGGSGFLGLNFLEELLHGKDPSRYNITVFTKSPSPLLEKIIMKFPNVKTFTGNYRNPEEVERVCKGQDIAYHFISETYPHNSWDNPGIEIETTFIPTLRLLDTLVKCKVKKIVFLSSAGTVYGLNQNRMNEETLTNPFSPHGIFKLTVEKFLNYYRMHHELNFDIYRVSNAYGPYQDIKKGLGFINTNLTNIIRGGEVVIYGDGTIVRDYVFVKDIARLLTLSLIKPVTDSDLYLACSGKECSLNELAVKMQKSIPVPFKVKYVAARPSDNKTVALDNAKILKYFPDFHLQSLESGILTTYNFIKNNELISKY